MTENGTAFLGVERLLKGPWQAFERAIARLMLANGFDDVRIVAGPGDHGADVLGTVRGELWVFQAKFTSTSGPPVSAVSEVLTAARFYGAHRMVVATSRAAGDALVAERAYRESQGLRVDLIGPSELLQLMARTPEYPATVKALRDYQDDACARFIRALVDTGRGQLVMATGLGKTVVMAETIASLFRDGLVRDRRALVMAHTRDLVDQLERGFWHQLPKWIPTHRLLEGEAPTWWDGITFATVQSAAAGIEKLPAFGVVLVDEAHHVGAETFRHVLARLDSPMVGGVTATPWRGDRYDIDEQLGPPVFRMGIAEGLARGFLSEVDYRLLADNLDWEFVQQRSQYRYSLGELNKRLLIPIRDEVAARTVTAIFKGEARRAAIAFCPSMIHAHEFARMLEKHGLRASPIVTDMEPRERDRTLSRFRAGDFDIVTTVDLFNEGVDVPDVDMIVFMRATHSRRIFVQQLGRGLRVTPRKDHAIVLDFVSDLRRVAEVLDLDRAVRGMSVERVSLGSQLVSFTDASQGSFLREWLLDQADLLQREGDPSLTLPPLGYQFLDYPTPPSPGGVQ